MLVSKNTLKEDSNLVPDLYVSIEVSVIIQGLPDFYPVTVEGNTLCMYIFVCLFLLLFLLGKVHSHLRL